MTRTELLDRLPKGGHVAEIGVARGDFAMEIVTRCRPKRLHLIDPWRPVPDAPNAHLDPHNVDAAEGEERYRSVIARFGAHPWVTIHRGRSDEILPSFPDGYFDWVYIDGDHRYEAVRADLDLCREKVAREGFIAGHDYTESDYAQALGFGVVRAVDEFAAEHGWRMVALTAEEFPTYVLAPHARATELERALS